jgi:hypothetical protein
MQPAMQRKRHSHVVRVRLDIRMVQYALQSVLRLPNQTGGLRQTPLRGRGRREEGHHYCESTDAWTSDSGIEQVQ